MTPAGCQCWALLLFLAICSAKTTIRELCGMKEFEELGSGETNDFEPAAVVYEVMNKRLEQLETRVEALEQRLKEVPSNTDMEKVANQVKDGLLMEINERIQMEMSGRLSNLSKDLRSSIETMLQTVIANIAVSPKSVIPAPSDFTVTTMRPPDSDCQQVAARGSKSGTYQLIINQHQLTAYCEVSELSGEAWMVIQRRMDGSTDFFRSWNDYKTGFGNLYREFYIGNEHLHQITRKGGYLLRVELKDQLGEVAYAVFTNFSIASEQDGYALHYSKYFGTAGNAMLSAKDRRFSTFDRDNDNTPLYNCATLHRGAFWYDRCGNANLNGVFHSTVSYHFSWQNIIWFTWKQDRRSMSKVIMKIRPE